MRRAATRSLDLPDVEDQLAQCLATLEKVVQSRDRAVGDGGWLSTNSPEKSKYLGAPDAHRSAGRFPQSRSRRRGDDLDPRGTRHRDFVRKNRMMITRIE